jgi:hypothetical protein
MVEGPTEEWLARDARRRRRFRRWALFGALALIVGALAAASSFMVAQAHRAAIACSNRFYDHPSAETSCRAAHAWLLIPRLVPWQRKAALAELGRVEWNEALRALDYSTSVAPDEKRLHRAARSLAALHKNEPTWKSGRKPSVLFELRNVGANAEIIRYAALARDISSRRQVLRAMLTRGDLAAAAAFAEKTDGVDDTNYAARRLHLEGGAVLCLTGKTKAGLAALGRAETIHHHFHTFPFREARLARAACGEQVDPDPSALDASDLWSFQLGGKLSGRRLEDRVLGRAQAHRIPPGAAVPFVAEAIAEREHTVRELLELTAALLPGFPGRSVLSPWLAEELSSIGAPDPSRDEKAAEQLESAAASTQPRVDGGGASPAAPTLPDDDLDAGVQRRAYKLRGSPSTSLKWAAWGFWIEATRIRGYQRQGKQALADARHALALRPGADTLARVVPALMRSGQLTATQSLLSASHDTAKPLDRAVLDLARTLIAMHERRWHDARAIAHKLQTSASLGNAARYLELAAAVLAKDGAPLPRLQVPHESGDPRVLWGDVFNATTDQRASARYHMRTLSLSTEARPAELLVLGRAVQKGSVEVWLDRELWGGPAYGNFLLAMRARAEAARWRGDAGSAQLWNQRAARVEKLLHNPRRRLLAKIAGL